MNPEEQNQLVDLVAQAVIDRIEQRDQISHLADMVVKRVLEMQRAESVTQQLAESVTQQLQEQEASDHAQI